MGYSYDSEMNNWVVTELKASDMVEVKYQIIWLHKSGQKYFRLVQISRSLWHRTESSLCSVANLKDLQLQ